MNGLIERLALERLIAPFLRIIAWFGLLLCHVASGGKSHPNILFILADDLGWGDLSLYGQKHFETPNIDRIAKEGIQFMQHYSGSTVCAPSRSSLMTGLHTGRTPIRGNFEVQPGDKWRCRRNR